MNSNEKNEELETKKQRKTKSKHQIELKIK